MKKIFFIIIILVTICFAKENDIVFSKNSEINLKQVESIFSEAKNGKGEKIELLVDMGDAVIPVLIKKISDKDTKTRRTALDLLGRIDKKDDEVLNKKEIVDVMVKSLKDSDHKVVNNALDFLMDVDANMIDKTAIDVLIEQLDKGKGKAARILGRVGDPSLIPILEKYVGKNVGMTINVRQALAKLGEKKYFDEIVAELNSEEYIKRVNAISKLGYIGNNAAIRKIAEFLYNTENPQSGFSDVLFTSYRHIAVKALARIISNPPVKKKSGFYTEQDVQIWREWWEKNKHKYE